jgi:hypothetical protein
VGASWFEDDVVGLLANEAFIAAVDQALWEHGHAGYSGTIAEKQSIGFKVVDPQIHANRETALAIARLHEAEVEEKWGPAGAVAYFNDKGEKTWLFFGWASS